VEIEDITSWPRDFFEIAIEKKNLLVSYHREAKHIDALCREDVVLRCKPPKNIHEDEYENLVRRLEDILNLHNIVSYHCTRLTEYEISEIRRGGMKVLSPELVQKRLINARDQNHLSREEYDYFVSSSQVQSNLSHERSRTGMSWLCPNRSTLKECSGVYRLFRSWGGEALYWGHEKDDQISVTLRRIGIPCIVKCSLPFRDAEPYHPSYAKRFLSYLISGEVEYPDPPAEFDMRIRRDLIASEVLEIIDIFNPKFGEFTDYKSWDEQCQIH